jgi:hypothetical protein
MDAIGRKQGYRENIDFAADVVRKMPARYAAGIPAPESLLTPYRKQLSQQGMEGVRQEEVEEQILKYFAPIKLFKFDAISRLILNHPVLGALFDVDTREDRDYVEGLIDLDMAQIESGRLRPTEMFGVFEARSLPSVAVHVLASLARVCARPGGSARIPAHLKELLVVAGVR